MKVIERINTNAAVAIDEKNKHIVILGKGVGFPKVPYDLKDLSVIERTFYDVDPRYIEVLANLPRNIILASTKVYEMIIIRMDCELNPNFPIILADHLQFAMHRIKQGIELRNPLEYELYQFYPKEIQVAKKVLSILEEDLDMKFQESEIASIALHIINAEKESSNMHETMKQVDILSSVTSIIETELNIKFDKENFYYTRFITHVRFLIYRLETNNQAKETSNVLLDKTIEEYPDIYACTMKILEYLYTSYLWKCNEEEILFLMLHINRLKSKNES